MSQREEAQYVLRAKHGDRRALELLFRSLQDPLYRFILSMVNNEHLAEDVLQDVLVLIYRNLRWLRDPRRLRPWAYRIASREAIRHIKRERRWSDQVRDEEVVDSIQTQAEQEDLTAHLPRLIARVSPASRAVLVLHYMEDKPLQDVADILGIALGTVKSRLSYGLAVVRQALSEPT